MKIKPPESERQLDFLSSENTRIRWLGLTEGTRQQIQILLAQLIAGVITANKKHKETQ